ncbi:MAG: methanogen output domain 1-containing protein [Thalassospira sp.]|uniref:methanogen output domain 1-containing protein n=1 Tax=Thalassospira sp. TaxID=1912094 RepID=UPI0032EFDFD8
MTSELASTDGVDLDKETFLIDLIRGLSGTLQDLIGLEEASGMISVVGATIGKNLNDQYRREFKTDKMNIDQVCHALVDLKKRIDGGFRVSEVTGNTIVLVNSACPFGKAVIGRKSMCMMTSNVFGKIAAENLGYARVELEETIAQGDPGCRVVIRLAPSESLDAIDRREYFREDD